MLGQLPLGRERKSDSSGKVVLEEGLKLKVSVAAGKNSPSVLRGQGLL
jgi:hypothetical protein